MKSITKSVVLCLMLLAYSVFPQTFDTLTILYVNDTHSCLSPLGPRDNNLQGQIGGIARAASVIGYNKMIENNVLTLHSGDYSIGDLFYNKYFGVAELQILNQLGFDALTLGNHEFDLSAGNLVTALDSAYLSGGFNLLSSNAIVNDDSLPRFHSLVKPFAIKQIGNIKIGIFGLTTPETQLLSNPYPVIFDTSAAGLMGAAVAMIDTLKSLNCNVIICLSHLGVEVDQMLAYYVPFIDVIIGGHDHLSINTPIEITNSIASNKTLITQAGAFYQNVGKMKIEIKNGAFEKLITNDLIVLNNTIPEEPQVKAVVQSLIQDIEAAWTQPFYTQAIGNLANDFTETADSVLVPGDKDTPVGNLVTDAFRAKTGTEIAICAGGSTAQPLYHGPIVFADVYRMLSYGMNEDNYLGYRLVTLKLKGSVLFEALAYCVSQVNINDEFLLQVSGMKYAYDPTKTGYEKLIPESIRFGNDYLDTSKIYTVTGNEFLKIFLDLTGFPYTDLVIFPALSEEEVVTEYIATHPNLTPIKEGRVKAMIITDVKDKNDTEIKTFELHQNYPNPFNPSTTIRFFVPYTSNVTLTIYDALGRSVQTLIDGRLNAGTYDVKWNAANHSTGIYFCKLSSDNFVQIKKMILMK